MGFLLDSTKAAVAVGAAAYLASRSMTSSRVQPGQVVLITGGSSGLGLALAHRFAAGGAKLVLAARSATDLNTARGEIVRRWNLSPRM